MSCKVITGRTDLQLQPLFPPAARTAEPTPLFRKDQAMQGTIEGPEAQRLQQRVAELEASLQAEVRQAREAGRTEGEIEGRDRARAELQPVLDRLGKSIGDLSTLRTRIRRDSESDLVKLSLCIARRILRRELTIDPDAVHGVVKAVLDKVQARDIRKVRVHPDFQNIIRSHVEISGVISASDIVADPSLQPGDVVVETRLGDLDASIESQLKEIERGFADRLSH